MHWSSQSCTPPSIYEFHSMVDTEISKWNLMTFPWPFHDLFKQKSQELCWKRERNAPRLAQLLWGYVIYIHILLWQFMNKTYMEAWKACKIFADKLIATEYPLEDPCLKTWYSYMKNIKLLKIDIFQWLPLIFNDFSRQNGIFPGQHQIPWLFKVSLKFHDFSMSFIRHTPQLFLTFRTAFTLGAIFLPSKGPWFTLLAFGATSFAGKKSNCPFINWSILEKTQCIICISITSLLHIIPWCT